MKVCLIFSWWRRWYRSPAYALFSGVTPFEGKVNPCSSPGCISSLE